MSDNSAGDLLLSWLSARGAISKSTMLAACRRLCGHFGLGAEGKHFRSLAWSLHRLGHIERPGLKEWAVAPAHLIHLRSERGKAICHFYGARDARLRRRFEKNGLEVSVQKQPGLEGEAGELLRAPALWQVEIPVDRLADISEKSKIPVCPERGLELLSALPDIAGLVEGQADSIPQMKLEKASVQSRNGRWRFDWVRCERPDEDGVYREVCGPRWWRVAGGKAVALRHPEAQRAAKWLLLRGDERLKMYHDAGTDSLSIPVVAVSLPILVDRALCIASGFVPALDPERRRWTYRDISQKRARQAGRVMGLEVVCE